jgi:hypothetical protein
MMALHDNGSKDGPKFLLFILPVLSFIIPRTKAINRIGPHHIDVISFLVGALLGDCHGERLKNGGVRFKFKQSTIHKKYFFFLYDYLYIRGYVNKDQPYFLKDKLGDSYYFNTYSHAGFL